MTEVTRDVIINLLPAYFSGEASEQTRQLVGDYFERDPEFARIAHSMNDKRFQALSQNHQMESLTRAQTSVTWRAIALAIGLSFIGLVLAFSVLVMFMMG